MKRTIMNAAAGATALTLLAAAPMLGQENPYLEPDDSWINIDGTVVNVMPDRFGLDYGPGVITVEMDDGDRDADGYKLAVGDKVSVSGRIDDDFFERATIEASSVFVENLGTYFYASALDEEDAFVTIVDPVEVSETILQGTVTEVGDEEFKILAGVSEITVEVEDMAYDPLDDEGYQKVEVGDVVSVTGRIDYDLFEGREMVAEAIITLKKSG